MERSVTISVFEVVGGPLGVASGDGAKVHRRLAAALKAERNVTLSFRDVTTLTFAFLNAAIGQLYGKFSEEKIRKFLHVRDMERDDRALLQRVVKTAKQYFEDPDEFNRVIKQAMDEV